MPRSRVLMQADSASTAESDEDATMQSSPGFLQDMNPYIDDITRPPAFHNFTKLPLELRYKIYEHYLSEDAKSITSRMWPVITINLELSFAQFMRQTYDVFLPKLCEVSHSMRAEVKLFVASSATFHIGDAFSMRRIVEFMSRPTTIRDLDMISNVRKLILENANDMLGAHLHKDDQWEGPRVDQADAACACINDNLFAFTELRTLSITLYAPTFSSYSLWESGLEAAPIDRFMEKLDLKRIAALEELETVELKGVSGYRSWLELAGGSPQVPKGESREHLEAVVRMASQLRDHFLDKDHGTEIRVQLLCADEDEAVTLG